MNETHEHYLEIDGVRMRYRQQGEGPPVLLLHGWGGAIESWGPVYDDLQRAYTAYAVDLPGFGASSLPPTPWGSADYSQWLLHVMARLQLDKPHIIGHSFGGQVAIRLASTHPKRIRKLVLVCSAGIRRRRTFAAQLKRSAARLGRWVAVYGGPVGDRVRDVIYRRVQSPDYANAGPLRPTLVKVVNEDVSNLLPRIQSPTLVVWGEHDGDVPLASARVMERLIPQVHLVVLENAGHFPYLDQFERFRLIVRRFLREQADASGNPQG
jgi:pimeloyl-ACP methyl ester carboxylesterase